MSKRISHTVLSPTLDLSECADGFWLYDKTQGINLSMKAKSSTAALVEALAYYQRRLTQVERKYHYMSGKVEAFVSQFKEDEESEK